MVDKDDRLSILIEDRWMKKPHRNGSIDEKLKVLLGSVCFQIGQPIAIECFIAGSKPDNDDHDDENFIPTWRKMYSEVAARNHSPSPNILYINEFRPTDLGAYLCRTKNAAGFVVDVGVEFKVDATNATMVVIDSMDESVIGEESKADSDSEEKTNEKETAPPNIRITFSDKLALARGERVELICDSGGCRH